jgi:uncharacterized protein (TIGR03437 family)
MKKNAGFFLFSLLISAADYTTYIGGTNTGLPPAYDVSVRAMTTDASGNTYLTGGLSANATSYIAFVTKLGPTGQLVFSKAFGGSGSDQGTAVAVDPSGNIYVAGNTTSPDLLVTNALQTAPSSIFVLKLSPDGKSVPYLSYFGGAGGTGAVNAVATDSNGNLYLTRTASNTNFPTTPGIPAPSLGISPSAYNQGAFISEISAAGDRMIYSGVVAGNNVPCPATPPMAEPCLVYPFTTGVSIAVDVSGNAYVAGNSNTTDIPTTSGVLASQGIGAFVMKVKSGGTGIGYLTYLGAGNYFGTGYPPQPSNVINSLAVDAAGDAYLSGETNDPKFPSTVGSYQSALTVSTAINGIGVPLSEAFLAKLAPDGSHMIWATYLGGAPADTANSIAVDPSGNVWSTGTTTSSAFPNTNGWSTGGDFLVEMSAAGTARLYSGRYPNQTVATAVALDPVTGLVHAAGPTGIVSGIAPTQTPTMRAFGLVNMAGGEISGRVAWGEMVSIYGPHIGPAVAIAATADSGALPTTLGGVQVSFSGQGTGPGNASLLYVSDSQINAILPALNGPVAMSITNAGTMSPSFPLVPERALPQIFTNADGSAAALNQDGTINSPSNRAAPGSTITIWASGTGNLAVTAGEITTSASNSCNSQCQINVSSLEAGSSSPQQAAVLYAGASPGFASGFTEIVFLIPPGIYSYFSFNLSVSGFASDPVTLYVSSL